MAACIEADQRHEDDIELACRAGSPAARFEDAEGAASHLAIEVEEAHAVMTKAGDAGQRHLTTAAARQFEQRGGVDLLGGRQVQADATAGSQDAQCIDASRELPALAGAFDTLDGTAP